MTAPNFERLGRDKNAFDFLWGCVSLPAVVAEATCFLQSDLAAFITGSTITVDGGMDTRG
jgi:NAD(P)-dependent dehydrogenase (short-subunit alcohol dehydrogenase family)